MYKHGSLLALFLFLRYVHNSRAPDSGIRRSIRRQILLFHSFFFPPFFYLSASGGIFYPAAYAGKPLWRLVAITSGSKVEEELKQMYADEGLDEDIITDTIINTGLLLKIRNQYYPVRDCAIKFLPMLFRHARKSS